MPPLGDRKLAGSTRLEPHPMMTSRLRAPDPLIGVMAPALRQGEVPHAAPPMPPRKSFTRPKKPADSGWVAPELSRSNS